MKKVAIYTAVFNNYDWLKEPFCPSPEIDYICYTDTSTLKSKYWKIIKVDLENQSPSLMNRKIKLLYPYTELADYEYTLYVDGSVMMKGDIYRFLTKYINKDPLLMNFKHPDNDCIFTEIDNCIKEGRGNAEKLKLQYDIYKRDGMPDHFGLSDNKIILRKNCEEGKQLMEEWFHHVVNYSGRDQVCLSYVLWKHHSNYCFFDEVIEQNEYFETWPHNTAPWYNILWRKIKWFSERTGFGWRFISFLNNRIKPVYLKRRGI